MPPSLQNQVSPPKHQKIVATVQPYSTNGFRPFAEIKKDCEPSRIMQEQETQTDADGTLKTNDELYAEIEKLNRFRKKMEEDSSKVNLASGPPAIAPKVSSINVDTIEQRHLKFYQERMKMLEEKITIYESSGDQQAKLLSRRLEHETQLEAKVNRLQEAVDGLKRKTQTLEESNCELEEIENETRHRWQRLEEDYEVMNQRNAELEMSKSCYQEKFEEARDSVEYLEECLHGSEDRIKALETRQKELKRRLQLSQSFIPAVALFQLWRMRKMKLPPMLKPASKAPSNMEIPTDHPMHKQMKNLEMREKQLLQNINDLNRAYQETLENADSLWFEMEKDYKNKISNYERLEGSLRSKILMLEKRLLKDTEDSNERIAALEENEYQLKTRAGKFNRDLKDQQRKNTELLDELSNAKDEHQKLQAYINGPLAENLEREKKKLRSTQEDLQLLRNTLRDTENAHKNEVCLLKRQLHKMHKELKNFEVTNSELKEEVETLERRIIELESYSMGDKGRIQELIDELETKSQQSAKPQRPVRQQSVMKNLQQELSQKPAPVTRQKTVIPIVERCSFADAIGKFEVTCFCLNFFRGNVFKALLQKHEEPEVKSFADSIISNAEKNGFIPIKRSFVEEVKRLSDRYLFNILITLNY